MITSYIPRVLEATHSLMEIPMTNGMQLWKRVAHTLAAIILPAGAAIGVPLMSAGAASAQAYPTNPIKVILTVPAGSVIDVTARMVTNPLSERLGKPVIVENRPGGGGTIGVKEFARTAPDGHSLLFGGLDPVFAAKVLGYDPVKGFIPIASVASHAWVLVVRPAIPARSVKELIDHAKANPGKLNWGFGQGTAPHMFGEMFKAATGIDVANIPYKSGTHAVPDMLGGRIDMNFGTVSNLLPLIREGKLRAIAITSEARSPDLPDVLTLAESGFPRLTRGNWAGFWAPAGTPADVVTRLNGEINAMVTNSTMKTAMQKLDFEPRVGSPRDFSTFILDEIDAWTPAAKAAGILPK
jgi:tripartite-type tricarboxylate transporter receptor subunit TctC